MKSWLKDHAATFDLIQGSGGVFRVDCNGRTIFDRAKEGRFPLYHEVQLRIFKMLLKPEDLLPPTREKWGRILQQRGLTWDQVLMKSAD